MATCLGEIRNGYGSVPIYYYVGSPLSLLLLQDSEAGKVGYWLLGFLLLLFLVFQFLVCFFGVGWGLEWGGGGGVEENLGWGMGERSVSVLDCFFLILTSFWVRLGKLDLMSNF